MDRKDAGNPMNGIWYHPAVPEALSAVSRDEYSTDVIPEPHKHFLGTERVMS